MKFFATTAIVIIALFGATPIDAAKAAKEPTAKTVKSSKASVSLSMSMGKSVKSAKAIEPKSTKCYSAKSAKGGAKSTKGQRLSFSLSQSFSYDPCAKVSKVF